MEKKIVLDEVKVTWIINTIIEFREVLTFEFEDDCQDSDDRLSCAKHIIECDNMVNYLKQILN